MKETDIDDSHLKKTEAIILSMTPQERRKPEIINPSRKKRIAAGCGLKVEDVNRVLNQHRQMQKLFKSLNGKMGSKKMRRYGMTGAGLDEFFK